VSSSVVAEYVHMWSVYYLNNGSGIMLLLSITLQIAGAQVVTLGAEIMAVALLLVTSLRCYGVLEPERRMIPSWMAQPEANYGASLLG
jgi:hypothetical protein